MPSSFFLYLFLCSLGRDRFPDIILLHAESRITVKPVDPVYYTIRFLNWDGAELQNSQVLEGNMPVYNGTIPVRPEDEQYTYSFSGWQPEIVAATANADYTAQFTATEKSATGIEEIDASQIVNGKSSNRKLMIDGILYILRPDGKVYDMTGQEVR